MPFAVAQAAPHLRYLIQRTTESVTQLHQPYAPGKWTRLELLGHLIDSASNNHQRIVRALTQHTVHFPAYDQEAFVDVQRFATAPPADIVSLWSHFNLHLAWVIEGIPPEKLSVPITVGADAPITLEQLILDYVAHLEHHLRQLLGPNSLLWSGLGWALSGPMDAAKGALPPPEEPV